MQDEIAQTLEEREKLFVVGNVLKSTSEDCHAYKELFVLVAESIVFGRELPDCKFNAVTLKFLHSAPSYVGKHAAPGYIESWNKGSISDPLWEISSFKEVADAE